MSDFSGSFHFRDGKAQKYGYLWERDRAAIYRMACRADDTLPDALRTCSKHKIRETEKKNRRAANNLKNCASGFQIPYGWVSQTCTKQKVFLTQIRPNIRRR